MDPSLACQLRPPESKASGSFIAFRPTTGLHGRFCCRADASNRTIETGFEDVPNERRY